MRWAAHLVSSGHMDSVTFCFYKVGHTHCEIDQRFSVLAQALSKCNLQTPQERVLHSQFSLSPWQEFQREISTSVRRVAGRDIECTVQQGAWDFQEWLAPLQIQVSGLTATENDPHVAHCFRIVPRGHLKQYAGHTAWAIEKAPAHVRLKPG